MSDKNGKRESNYSHMDDDEVKEIDLTLKLGPSAYNCNQNQEDDSIPTCRGAQGFSGAASKSSNDVANWIVEYNSTSPAYCTKQGESTQYMVYPSPHHNVTTPNRKRPSLDDTKACRACGSNTTPLWRKGPDGPQTLCNACGLRHLRTVKRGGE